MVGADVLALPTRDRQDCHPGSQRAAPAVEMVALRWVITLRPPAAFRSKLDELLSCGGAVERHKQPRSVNTHNSSSSTTLCAEELQLMPSDL